MHVFLVLWVIATLVNLWVGVHQAGYSVRGEAPNVMIVSGIAAIAAGLI